MSSKQICEHGVWTTRDYCWHCEQPASRAEKEPPVAYIWEGTLGEGTRSLRWVPPHPLHEYASKVIPLYAAPVSAMPRSERSQVIEECARLCDEFADQAVLGREQEWSRLLARRIRALSSSSAGEERK